MRHRDEVAPKLHGTPAASELRHQPSGRLIYLIALVSFFVAGAAWSLATPLLAAPDEPSQIVKAAAVAHGHWTAVCYYLAGPCTANSTSALGGEFGELSTFYNLIRAPDSVNNGANSQICFKNHKELGLGVIPASCARSVNTPATPLEHKYGYDVNASTYQARYPPLYYAIVGIPTHLAGSSVDVYLMRLISALLNAIFLALALTAAVVYSSNRLLVAGLVIAATPMVFFLAGVINASGLEISSAVALWTTGAILVTERLSSPPRGLVAMFGASAITMELVRPLSPLWLALSVVVLLVCAERKALQAALKTRSVQACLGMIALFGVAALWWIVAVHATDLYLGESANVGVASSVSTSTIIETAFRHNTFYLPDMIGVFGWFDTYSPTLTYVLWYGFIGLITLAAASRSRSRAVLFTCFVAAILIIPVVIETSHARVDGYTWSGRDLLPFAVGLPILASATLGNRPWAQISATRMRHLMTWLIVLAAIAQFAAFYEALRRYAVGTKGPIFGFLSHAQWHPAIGILGALAFDAAALIGLSLTYKLASNAFSSPPTTELIANEATTVSEPA